MYIYSTILFLHNTQPLSDSMHVESQTTRQESNPNSTSNFFPKP